MTDIDALTIRSQSDLQRAWHLLARPLGFRRRSLWLLLIGGDDRPTEVVTQIDEVPETPSRQAADALAELLSQLADIDAAGRWALLLCRPGRGRADATDLAWAASLYDALSRARIPHDTLHLATDDDIVSLPLDATAGHLRAS